MNKDFKYDPHALFFRERASIAAMQGLLANADAYESFVRIAAENRHKGSGATIVDVVSQFAVAYADALIKRLRER